MRVFREDRPAGSLLVDLRDLLEESSREEARITGRKVRHSVHELISMSDTCLVGEGDGGEIVGVALAKTLERNVGVIYSLFVKKEFRRKGLGEKLVEGATGYLRDTEFCKRVVVTVFEKNIKSRKLFEKFGFRRVISEWSLEIRGRNEISS